MALNMAISLLRGTKKMTGRRLATKKMISYAAAVTVEEVDEGILSSNETVDRNLYKLEEEENMKKTRNIEECDWVPHPRSGIYFPKGHGWVLEDVSHSAVASSAPSFWLRSIDGVDAPHIDT